MNKESYTKQDFSRLEVTSPFLGSAAWRTPSFCVLAFHAFAKVQGENDSGIYLFLISCTCMDYLIAVRQCYVYVKIFFLLRPRLTQINEMYQHVYLFLFLGTPLLATASIFVVF